MKILLIEDDRETGKYIIKGLNENGYTVDYASEGNDGLYLAMNNDYETPAQ